MINLCLVVIATQFSETKKRETERMAVERARRRRHSRSSSTGKKRNSQTDGLTDRQTPDRCFTFPPLSTRPSPLLQHGHEPDKRPGRADDRRRVLRRVAHPGRLPRPGCPAPRRPHRRPSPPPRSACRRAAAARLHGDRAAAAPASAAVSRCAPAAATEETRRSAVRQSGAVRHRHLGVASTPADRTTDRDDDDDDDDDEFGRRAVHHRADRATPAVSCWSVS